MNADSRLSPRTFRETNMALSLPLSPPVGWPIGAYARSSISFWPLRFLAAALGFALFGALPSRAETDLPLAYLRGQHRVVFRVTARGSQIPPAMPGHCTLTYTQAVLLHEAPSPEEPTSTWRSGPCSRLPSTPGYRIRSSRARSLNPSGCI